MTEQFEATHLVTLNLWQVLDQVAAPIFIQDDQHRIVFVNQALCQRSHYSEAEFLDNADRILSPNLRAGLDYTTQAGYLYDANGIAQEISVTKSSFHDDQGIPFIVGTIVDLAMSHLAQLDQEIQERKAAEIALLRSQQRLTLLIQQSPFVFVEWGADYKIQTWNLAAQHLFGYSRKEAVGQSLEQILPEFLEKEVLSAITPLLTQSGVTQQVQKHTIQGGEAIVCEWYHYPLLAPNGGVMSIVSMGNNITDRVNSETERRQAELALLQSEQQLRCKAQELEQAFKQLQKTQTQLIQTEKMSSLGQLVAGIAHEINNPVSFIYGNLDHAKHYIEDLLQIVHLYQIDHPHPSDRILEELEEMDLEFMRHDLTKLIDSMATGAERIRDIVRSLRNFSRHDEAELKAVDVHEGLESTLMLLQHLLKANRTLGNVPLRPLIQVVKHYDRLPKVQCYAGLLNQVFMNLLTNAIEAIDERWTLEEMDFLPEIEIETLLFTKDSSGESSPWARIRITDNGIGMSDAAHQRLFDPFFTTKSIGQGAGLGLSISYQIVTEQHQGRLLCDRKSKRGATFVIEIPVRQLQWS